MLSSFEQIHISRGGTRYDDGEQGIYYTKMNYKKKDIRYCVLLVARMRHDGKKGNG